MLERSSLSEMLAGRTPEAMYDALHARRCLSDRALSHPDEVLDFLRSFLRTSRRAAFLPRLAEALVDSRFLNEEGRRLAEAGPADEESGRRPADDDDGRCPQCHGDDLEVVGIREVHRPSRTGGASSETGPVVARRIDFRCRACGYDGSILRRVR